MRTQEQLVQQRRYYKEQLVQVNRRLDEARRREDLTLIRILLDNQVMYFERVAMLEWVLEIEDEHGVVTSFDDTEDNSGLPHTTMHTILSATGIKCANEQCFAPPDPSCIFLVDSLVGGVRLYFCQMHSDEQIQKRQQMEEREHMWQQETQQTAFRQARILRLALATEPEITYERVRQQHTEYDTQYSQARIDKNRKRMLSLGADLLISALLVEHLAKQQGIGADSLSGTLFALTYDNWTREEIELAALAKYGV